MTRRSKSLILVAAAMLLLIYVAPLWWIILDAPQYPEGLGLYIWVHKITGQNPNDLNTINGLNHYIGMKHIKPDSIPELRYMPYIAGFLIVSGIASGLSGKRWAVGLWIGLFALVLAAGLIDFYLWEYDYGHNLDPSAAIKVPGMSYQPPLIGTKQLLNMRTTSIPHLGGIVVGLSFLLAAATLYVDWRRNSKKGNVP